MYGINNVFNASQCAQQLNANAWFARGTKCILLQLVGNTE